MIDFLERYLSWRPFVIGVFISLAGASGVGWVVTERDNFPGFVRFYRPIMPESLYYPTARQVAALVNNHLASNKIAVLIGGSSVFRGVSQRQSNVWTLALQNELGPQYSVINLAMNGGGAVGIASYMTEMLTKEGKRAILVADMIPGTWMPDSPNPYYRYFYFEAEARGYLYSSAPRSAYLAGAMDNERIALKIRALGNSLLNYEELWQYVGICCSFTVYSSLMADAPWGPRWGVIDTEAAIAGFSMKTLPSDRNAAEMKIVRGYSESTVDCAAEMAGLNIAFPNEIKKKIILVGTGQAPFYKNQLSDLESVKLDQFYDAWSRCIADDGLTPAFVDQILDDDDHYDRVHLTERGGKKLAEILKPIVLNTAKELGYVE